MVEQLCHKDSTCFNPLVVNSIYVIWIYISRYSKKELIFNKCKEINFLDLPSGSPLDLSLDKKALEGEEGLERLMAFAQSFLDKGGNMLTISVNSVDELKRAQKEPEKYRHLRVRVGGWQAYFVDLTRDHQDHHIARLELYA